MKEKLQHRALRLNYTFSASAPTLFDAWITKPVAEIWLFKSETNRLNFEADVKEGAGFSVDEKEGGKKIGHRGKYLRMDRPNSLRFTLEVPDHFEGVSDVLLQLKETPAGTELAFTQSGIDTSKTRASWEAMFANLDAVLRHPYLVTIRSGINELVPAILVTAMQVVGLARHLDEEKWNTVPYPGSWTPAQLTRHLTKSVTGIGGLLQKPGTPAGRDAGERILGLKQTFLDITKTMQSPDFIVPEEKHYDKALLIKEFEAALSPLTKTEGVNEAELITDLPLGPVTKLESLHFIFYHLQRHLIQMKRIVEALN